MKNTSLVIVLLVVSVVSVAQKQMRLIENKEKKRVDVLWGRELLTSYRYDDSVAKPFLFPVNTLSGKTVTRGWPLEPRTGERTDHPHHTGVWMNYESVNGLDFWNNSTAIPAEKKNVYGTIRHDSIVGIIEAGNSALLRVKASWLYPDGHVLMKEETSFHFIVANNEFFIERKTALTSLNEEVVFKDAKDGFYAIRVARELELPSNEGGNFTDAHGKVTNVPKMASNEGITGNYISSEGRLGDSVWGTKGTWVMLQGRKDGTDITIAMIDHPGNLGYPSYWHARGYGLFAVNPLGRKIFSNGKEELNFILKPRTSVVFRYSLIIAERKISAEEMNKMAGEFAKRE